MDEEAQNRWEEEEGMTSLTGREAAEEKGGVTRERGRERKEN